MRVLVAILSTLVRARTEQALQHIPTARIVGSVRDGRQAADLVGSAAPDLCLCDAALYPDVAAALAVAQPRPGPGFRLILLISRGQSIGPTLPSGVSALLPSDLPPAELAAFLQTMVDTDPVVPGRADPTLRPDPPVQGAGTGRTLTIRSSPGSALPGGWGPTSTGSPRPLPPVDRRQASDERLLFKGVVTAQERQHATDPVTDLPSLETLRTVAGRVQALGYPISVVVCGCRFAPASVVPTDLTTYNRLLRRLAGTVRAAVREYDLACRMGGMTFAVLLPGTPAANAHVVASRIAGAVAALEISVLSLGTDLRVAVATGGWEPGEAPFDIFDRTLVSLVWQPGDVRTSGARG